MPLEYVRDDDRRRVTLRARGDLTLADAIAAADRQLADHAWAYAVLYDARERRQGLGSNELQQLVAHLRILVAQHGPMGPMAMVATDDSVYAAGRMYSIFCESIGCVTEVFHDIAAAELWLERLAIPTPARDEPPPIGRPA